MPSKQGKKGQAKSKGRSKKVKLSDLHASKGGAVKGGASSIKTPLLYNK